MASSFLQGQHQREHDGFWCCHDDGMFWLRIGHTKTMFSSALQCQHPQCRFFPGNAKALLFIHFYSSKLLSASTLSVFVRFWQILYQNISNTQDWFGDAFDNSIISTFSIFFFFKLFSQFSGAFLQEMQKLLFSLQLILHSIFVMQDCEKELLRHQVEASHAHTVKCNVCMCKPGHTFWWIFEVFGYFLNFWIF